jgi:hypothetical protein
MQDGIPENKHTTYYAKNFIGFWRGNGIVYLIGAGMYSKLIVEVSIILNGFYKGKGNVRIDSNSLK